MNWQPPPGEAQARQPTSAAYSRVICFCAKRAPMVWALAASSPLSGKQGDAAGDKDGGQITCGGEGHHHRRQSFVAGGDSQHAGTRGQRAHETAEDDGCVVAEGKRIHHAQRALSAAVARVGAGSGERYGVQSFQLARGFGDEQADFPVAGVKSQSNGAAVFGAKAAMGAEDEDFGPGETRRVPAHAGVLAQSEKIA